MKTLVLLALTLVGFAMLGGCATYSVDYANPSSITIKYNTLNYDIGHMEKLAQKHCGKYGKTAVPKGTGKNGWGGGEVLFICVKE